MTAATIIGQLLVAALLFVVGRWGRRNATTLAPASLGTDERARRAVVLRRGAAACQVAGGIFALMVIPLLT